MRRILISDCISLILIDCNLRVINVLYTHVRSGVANAAKRGFHRLLEMPGIFSTWRQISESRTVRATWVCVRRQVSQSIFIVHFLSLVLAWLTRKKLWIRVRTRYENKPCHFVTTKAKCRQAHNRPAPTLGFSTPAVLFKS